MEYKDYKDSFGIIYKLTNLINNKCYVGQSCAKDKKQRINAHFTNAFNKKRQGYNKHLHNAIRKYGKPNFKIEVLCTCNDQKELDRKEDYYIIMYNSIENGYNKKTGGGGGCKYTEEIKNRISEKAKINFKGSGNPRYGSKVSQEQKIKTLNTLEQNNHIKPMYLYKINDTFLEFIAVVKNKRHIEKELGFSRRYILWQLKGELCHVKQHYFSYTELTENEQVNILNKYLNRHKNKGTKKLKNTSYAC